MINTYHIRKEINSIAKEALSDYFQPIRYIFKSLNKTLSFEEEKKTLTLKYEKNLNVLRVIQKSVCFNQGKYLEYTFLTAEKHRNLKDAFRENKNDLDNISILTANLTNYINKTFYENTRENFKILHAYFKHRKGRDPRICIKGNFRLNNKSTVVSVFRDEMVNYESGSEVSENFGFKSVYKTGKYYIENNIPKATAEGTYYNPRLDKKRVRDLLGYDKNQNIKKWSECWVGDKSENNSSFYKSTLIVPMTLWNNKVSDEFKKLINMANVDRTIFGFLCFDHEDEDYFNEEEDTSVGYVFADIISMYVFTRLVYMEISKTFSSAESWLDENNVIPDTESLSAIWKNIPSSLDPDEILGIKTKETKDNDLFTLDEGLLKFANSLNENANE